MPVTIRFSPSANRDSVSDASLQVLQNILVDAGLLSCKVTSTSRTPEEQAQVMYRNIRTHGAASQKKLYAAPGDKVIAVCEAHTAAGASPGETVRAMLDEILALGPGTVSRHCCDPSDLNVIDIAPSSIADREAFLRALLQAKTDGLVSRFFSPEDGDPAFHVEIPQGNSGEPGIPEASHGLLLAARRMTAPGVPSRPLRPLRPHYTRLPRKVRARADAFRIASRQKRQPG